METGPQPLHHDKGEIHRAPKKVDHHQALQILFYIAISFNAILETLQFFWKQIPTGAEEKRHRNYTNDVSKTEGKQVAVASKGICMYN